MRHCLAILAATLLLGAAPAPLEDRISYELAPVEENGAIVALAVTARLRGDPSGTTRFDWIPSWAGEDKLGQWSRDMVVEGAASTELAPHGGRVIRAAPGAPLTIRYRIISAYAADPTVDDSRQARPVVRPGWFYSVGEALFAVPDRSGDTPIRFRWSGPAAIGFASDLEHPAARAGFKSKTIDDLAESIVIGGRDLRVVRSNAGGAPLRVATVGKFAFDIAAFDRLAQQTIATEREFWRDRSRQSFLITMVPNIAVAGRLSYGGTGRSDAFALWMDNAADLSGIGWLLAHEYFHTWNARQLGRMDANGPEEESYWLSEGFTDLYARRLMLRAGLMTPQEFADSWNETLAAYAASPYRTTGNVAAGKLFWQDQRAEKLPYQRGAMLAAIWDQRQRKAGRPGLDAILRDQRDQVRRMQTSPALTTTFARVAAAHGIDVAADVARHIERGEAIALPADAFGRCARVATITRPVFERGYDGTATAAAGNVVTGLDRSSPAYAAGLREGMKILARTAGIPGNSEIDYVLKVRDGAAERVITFRPAGRTSETLQQLVLDQARFAADPRGCAVALAG